MPSKLNAPDDGDNHLTSGSIDSAPLASQPTLVTTEKLVHSWSVSSKEAVMLTVKLATALYVISAVPILMINFLPIIIPQIRGIVGGLPATYVFGLAIFTYILTLLFSFAMHQNMCKHDTRISFTNRRLIKFGTREEFLDFEDNAVALSVRRLGSDSGLLSFVGTGKGIKMYSRSLQNDLQKLPEQLSNQIANIAQPRMGDAFFAKSISAEEKAALVAPMLKENEKLIGIFQTNLSGMREYAVISLICLTVCIAISMFLTYIHRDSHLWTFIAILSTIIFFLPLNFYLRNKDSHLILTTNRVLRIASSGRIKVVCPFARVDIRRQDGGLSLNNGLETYTFKATPQEEQKLPILNS